jgi:uncharacterized membrane protein
MKNKNSRKNTTARYIFAFVILAAGIILEALNIGDEFLGFESVGEWLIYVGFIMLVIITITLISKKKRIIDERMEKIAYQASRISFLAIIIGAFIIMIADGIKPIEISYSMFMAYLISGIVLVYLISYKIIEKFY